MSVGLGMAVMTVMGLVMYLAAPLMMGIMTPVQEIKDLGVSVLRIEAFAEPMYAASIVAYCAFIGTGDTLIPSCMNFFSIWVVRLTLAALLAPVLGLKGVWIAMCIELCFRGASSLSFAVSLCLFSQFCCECGKCSSVRTGRKGHGFSAVASLADTLHDRNLP